MLGGGNIIEAPRTFFPWEGHFNIEGLDIHKKNTQACVKDENGKVIVNERFLSDVVAINAFLDRLHGAEAKVVMEATGFYQYIYETIHRHR